MPQSPRFPNLYIVGAPKCGTTALARYLSAHPDVFAPERKEFTYFGSDLRRTYTPMSEPDYLAHFAAWRDETYALDASPFYLGSRNAPIEIAAASPGARIIAMVRNPIEMAYSLYYELRFAGTEDADTFERALALEPRRAGGECLSPNMRNVDNHLYTYQARYTEKLERYRDVFGAERCHVVVYDDLKADPAETFLDVQRFLELSPISLETYAVINRTKAAKLRGLNRLIDTPPGWLKSVSRRFLGQAARDRIRRRLREANSRPVDRPGLPAHVVRDLTETFSADVAQLGAFLGRDLSHWLRDRHAP